MTQHQPTDRWRFTLTQLLFAMTTIALAFGALRSPLPTELSWTIAICVPMFWTGMAIVTFGSGLVTSQFSLARGLGDIVVVTGFAFAIVGFLCSFTLAFAGLVALFLYILSLFGR